MNLSSNTSILRCLLRVLPAAASLFLLQTPVLAQQKKPAHRHARAGSAKTVHKQYPTHYGTASFYANKFEGRKTASGEIFSQERMTAASNIIPLQNWVRVTNLRNKRSVVLRINDRMHPKNPRLIDLSRAAAKRLRYTSRGIVKVKVEVLGKKLPEEFARN
jgi:rare lipoprotein A